MSQAYDLYKEDESGKRIFVETVIGLDQVEERLMKLAALKPGKYLVWNPAELCFVDLPKKSRLVAR